MDKIAGNLNKLFYYSKLKRHNVKTFKQHFYTHEFINAKEAASIYLPCFVLNSSPYNNLNLDGSISPIDVSQNKIMLWFRAVYGKRAWKKPLINVHRENIIEILSLFSKPDHFYDIKIQYSSFFLPKFHFNKQLILSLHQMNLFEDRNNLFNKVESIESFEDIFLINENGCNFSNKQIRAGYQHKGCYPRSKNEINRLGSNLNTRWSYYVITEGIYTNYGEWISLMNHINFVFKEEVFHSSAKEYVCTSVYMVEYYPKTILKEIQNDIETLMESKHQDSLEFLTLKFKSDQRIRFIYCRRYLNFQLQIKNKHLNKLLIRLMGSQDYYHAVGFAKILLSYINQKLNS